MSEAKTIEVKTVIKESQRLPTGNYAYTFDGENRVCNHKRMHYFFTGSSKSEMDRKNALSAINTDEYESILIEDRDTGTEEKWQPTMELGWKKNPDMFAFIGFGRHGYTPPPKILMQRWVSNTGKQEWREVGMVNE